LRIVIVVFLARSRHLKIDRAELICRAGSHGRVQRDWARYARQRT
jgi:hypothetical protein